MSRFFNREISLKELSSISEICSFDNKKMKFSAISDGNVGGESTICAYVKGKKPLIVENQLVIASQPIEGYNVIISDNPKKLLNQIIVEIKDIVGFKEDYIGKTNFNNVVVGRNCVIEDNVFIGAGTRIEHNVVLHSGTYIGEGCIVRSGSIIGGEGYGFSKEEDGTLVRENFLGDVIIGNNVEIGYGCAIVRGLINDTIISDGTKLDNLVHIAHDCNIGRNTTITAGVSLCGHVSIGENSRLAPNSTVKQRIHIGKNCTIGLGAVVLKNVPDGDVMIGNPALSLTRKRR
ncbi:UDP-3-O-(3-hydroxymyristoyl)glucosamine N-acyltransferase [Vibrio cholerae]|uniref:UDP-3-O-(3-hydroxymyristoyl)glucosamine N-acyltransferase n=1 Tax=Vibrio cholerae TaxID=666 RepID=UPI0030804BC3